MQKVVVVAWAWAVIVAAGCGPNQGTSISVLSEAGPYPTMPRPIFAARSIPGLLQQLTAARAVPSGPQCSEPRFRKQCWTGIPQPPGTVVVAAVIGVPCTDTKSVDTSLSGDALTITVTSDSACSAGEGSAVSAELSLIAIDSSKLPKALDTIRVLHQGAAGVPPSLSAPVQTQLDMR